MTKKIIRVLGIESSCDETSVSIVEKSQSEFRVLSNVVKSQIDIHKFYGGVVPELAARAHSDIIDKLIIKALSEANITKINLARKIKKYLKKTKISIITSRSDPDKRDYIVSNEKIENLGFVPQKSIDDGIKEIINALPMLRPTREMLNF